MIKYGFCLENTPCFTFNIYDASSDGLAITGCEGSFYIQRPDHTKLIENTTANANFGASKSFNFCLADNLGFKNSSTPRYAINLYPNPANDFITIESETTSFEKTTIFIRNVEGKIVYEYSNDEFTKLNIPLAHLSNGCYQIQFITSKENWNEKLIINHK